MFLVVLALLLFVERVGLLENNAGIMGLFCFESKLSTRLLYIYGFLYCFLQSDNFEVLII